jgi:hypothetical protein
VRGDWEGLTDVVLVAVQDGLVAPELLTYADEGGNDSQSELAALDRGRDGDVLDVAYEACVWRALREREGRALVSTGVQRPAAQTEWIGQTSDELALDQERACAYDLICLLVYDDCSSEGAKGWCRARWGEGGAPEVSRVLFSERGPKGGEEEEEQTHRQDSSPLACL